MGSIRYLEINLNSSCRYFKAKDSPDDCLLDGQQIFVLHKMQPKYYQPTKYYSNHLSFVQFPLSGPTWTFYGFRPLVFFSGNSLKFCLILISGSAPRCVPGESAVSANAVSPSTAAVNLRCLFPPQCNPLLRPSVLQFHVHCIAFKELR